MTSQLDENGKQLKTQSKIEKEACEFKSRGNRKQFEFNASVDAILTDIASKADSPDEVKSLANEGKEIRKRQKLVKLADRNSAGVNKTRTGSDRIGSDRIDKTRTGSDRISKTWIGLSPIDKTRTGSEKNRIAIKFPPK